jgi:D-3-phosphoglycerate dehydrogenase
MAEYCIQTLNKISKQGLSRFPAGRYEVGDAVAAPDAILVRSQQMHGLDIPTSVRAIGRAGAGVNNIPVAAMSERGVPVFNAPGANANAVKELVLAGMLLAARNLIPALRFVDQLEGDDAALHKQVEEGKKHFVGSELPGKTLGIVGLGAIGGLVADSALRLGMQVYGYDPEITVDAAWRLSSQVKKAQTVEELLKHCDFVTLHVPLVDATRNLINAERIKAMKTGTILLNYSREGIVDNDAVVTALAAGKMRGYVCDFPANALKGQPKVLTLPHLGASTQEAEENCAIMVADQVREYLEHGSVRNAVNFPAVEMARESPFRIAVANANVPNMVGQISTAMAAGKLNIHNMVNRSRGDMAYTLVDVDSDVAPEVIAHLAAIPGVLAVRYLPLPA